MPWVTRGLLNGVVTTRWPHRPDTYFDDFPAAVQVVAPEQRLHLADPEAGVVTELDDSVSRLCPTGAITAPPLSLDRGRCILCGRCVRARPDLFQWDPGADTARQARDQLVVSEVPDTDENLDLLRNALARRVRQLRRSVHIRHIDTGSDGSDEWEIQALTNPVYDLHRLGIFFTASPRHADILLITGIGAAGMNAPLARTRTAMPDPVVVIATGAEAASGGALTSSYMGSGVTDLIDVDIWVPGSPAAPFSLLHAILLALGRLPAQRARRLPVQRERRLTGRPPESGRA